MIPTTLSPRLRAKSVSVILGDSEIILSIFVSLIFLDDFERVENESASKIAITNNATIRGITYCSFLISYSSW